MGSAGLPVRRRWSGSRFAAGREQEEPDSPEEDWEDGEEGEEGEEDQTLYFGGVSVERPKREEETEQMRIASRINEALALRRAPRKPGPLVLAETAWYDEFGVSPTASMEEIRLKYLEHAEEAEGRLAYLIEENATAGTEESEDTLYLDDDDDNDNFEEDPEESEGIILQSKPGSLAEALGGGADAKSEAERVTLEFTRLSNLYQILSVPQLRKIYDDGGVEGLALRVPGLYRGLLEPERVLYLARGQQLSRRGFKESLLLRKQPRDPSFRRYEAANSIRQVLGRMTNMFRVKKFMRAQELNIRRGTIYTQLPEIAVFGRVNSGKTSMLAHMFHLCNPRRKRMLMRSQSPGNTWGVDMFCVNKRFTICDMPGYTTNTDHQAGKMIGQRWDKQWKPLIEEYLNTTHWMRAAIYCHDIAKDVTQADLDFVNTLRRYKIPILLVLTKGDKVDSDTHRLSRVRMIRKALHWPRNMPHAYYSNQFGGYSRVFRNLLGTMMLGLLATEERQDAWQVLKTECSEIYFDYRDKWIPKPRGRFGKILPERKFRTYPKEDKLITDEDLAQEEKRLLGKERDRYRKEKEATGEEFGKKDLMDVVGGQVLTPKERRKRWEDLLEQARR